MAGGPRKLNLFDATMLVMGGIIGVGIFFKPAGVAEWVPETWAYFTMWVLGALAALAGAMTFAELAGSFPRTGGWYVYLREGFGGFVAFLFAWIVLLVIASGACAGVADFFAQQLGGLLGLDVASQPDGSPPATRRLLAAGAVLGITALAMTGIKSGAVFQNLCMLAKLLAIGTLVVVGLAFFGEPALATEVPRDAVKPGGLGSRMIGAALPVLFTYGGWQLLTYIAPHVEDPQRNLPRAIVLGVAGVGVVYLLFNAAYVRVLGMGGVLGGDAALRLAEATLGDIGGRFLTAAIAVSALGFLVATLISTPGIYVAMAREGLFFGAVGRAHPRTGAPVVALAIQAGVTLGYIAFHSDLVGQLADAVVFAEWIFHGLVALALLHLRRSRKGLDRPFRSPLYPLFPLLYGGIAAAVVVGNLLTSDWSVTAQGLAVLAVGALVYLPWRRLTAGTRAELEA